MAHVYEPPLWNEREKEDNRDHAEDKSLPPANSGLYSCPWQPVGGDAYQSMPQGGSWYTSRFLRKYELTRVLQKRSNQLDLNAPPEVALGPHDDRNPITIAQREMYEKRPCTDMTIERRMPMGLTESPRAHALWQHVNS